MKKLFFVILLFIALILSGCGYKGPIMDQIGKNGNYHYQNKDSGFSFKLPPEFQYYQTQRKETEDYIDIEFFVPTTDVTCSREVPGYGKPIVIRVFDGETWQSMTDNEYKLIYQELVDKDDRVYTIRFWNKIPFDWQDKWKEEMKETITESFIVE